MTLNADELACKLERTVTGVVHTENGGERLSLSLHQVQEILSAIPSDTDRPRVALASFTVEQKATILDSLQVRALDRQADEYGDGRADAAADLYRLATGEDPS